MGSELKFNYSVLGDSVNLASRLEGQSKEYGFPIIVGSKTALAAKDRFAILELDFIMVKGKKEPEVIYAIAGREDMAQSAHFQRLRNLTIEMLACYRSRDWDGALARDRARPHDRRGRIRLRCFTISTKRASADYPERSAAGRLERRLRVADEIALGGRLIAAMPATSPTRQSADNAESCLGIVLPEQRDAVDRERRESDRGKTLPQHRQHGSRRSASSRPVSVMWKRNSSIT